jgi:cellobiose-specific phosphotransferase system component IIA
MANAVSGGIKNIKASLKLSGDVYEKEINQSTEKINAMHNVLTKMADMEESDVIEMESVICG